MQFQVPQFIEIEDKIIGPLTLKQFAYLAAAALLSFGFFFIFQLWLWLVLTVTIGAIAGSMAFIKVSGRPFLVVFLAALSFIWRPKFYIWKREEDKALLPSLPNIERIRKAEEVQKPLENLWEKLNTTTQPIQARERPGLSLFKKLTEPVEKFEVQRKLTGERRVYKRVDYR